jgi:hypothetical protein
MDATQITVVRSRDGHVIVTIRGADALLYADLTVLEDALVARDAGGTITIQVEVGRWDGVKADLVAAGLDVPAGSGPGEGCLREYAVTAIQRVQPHSPLLVTGPGSARLLKMVIDALDGSGKAAVVALGGQPGLLVATAVVDTSPHQLGTPESLLKVDPLTGKVKRDAVCAALIDHSAVVLFGLEHASHELVQQICASYPLTSKLIAVGDPSCGTGSFFATAGATETLFEDRVYPVRPDDELLWRLWCGSSVLAGEYAKLLPEAGSQGGDVECVVSWGDPPPLTTACTFWSNDPDKDERPLDRLTKKQTALVKRLSDAVAALGDLEALEPGAMVQLLRAAGGYVVGTVARIATLDETDGITVVIGTDHIKVEPAVFELRMRTGSKKAPRSELARLEVPAVRPISKLLLPVHGGGGVLVPPAVRLVLVTDGGELNASRLLQLRGSGGTLVRRGPLPSRLHSHPAVKLCRDLIAVPSRDYTVERVTAEPQVAGGFERHPFEDVFSQSLEVPVGFEPLCMLYRRAQQFHKRREQRFTTAALKQQSAAKKSTRRKQQRCRNVAAAAQRD